ncbi:MAG: hypothetical protein V1649_03765 [Patescibacteria group bacterium]
MLINLEILVKKIAKKYHFQIVKKIYQAYNLANGDSRNIIYSGFYQNKQAVLKIYNDSQLNDEPIALKIFNKINKSKILIAPQLYEYKIISPKSGWLIMEKIPDKARHFLSPINDQEKDEFLKVFFEYRKNFSINPTRRLSLLEYLPANKFHLARINRWLEVANIREACERRLIIKPEQFIPRLNKALLFIDKEFANRKMIWCHGHVKPKEIFKVKGNLYYLTDFAHVNLYPEGYELAFIIWADYLMSAPWQLGYAKWKQGINNWIDKIEQTITKEMKIKNFRQLIRASLIERIIGAILIDASSEDKSIQEKIGRMELLYKIFDSLI